ncbi:MAG: 2-dehydropantoate 2-reductase [Chloroflexaceae bacterium]|nr:2-dehydropantoate 2-reductase [Chloroflexaceae bacterium]
MKICIVGAGAIGGYLGVMLAKAGEEVTFIARGATLDAIRREGMKLIMDNGTEHVAPVAATDDVAQAGPQDAVIIALKTNVLSGLAPTLRPLYGPETMVVTAQNGIPWWYFHKHGGQYDGHRLTSVDPDGVLAQTIEPERIIGAVVYPAADRIAPNVVQHTYGNRFMLGEPDGRRTERIQKLSQSMTSAGFKAPVRPNIRQDIWIKLWGNLAFNPVSALTRATLEELARHPLARDLIAHLMQEGQMIGERLDIDFGISIDQRIKWAEDVGAHKTSTLQDIEAGRETEIDSLVGVVIELGQLVGVDTPYLKSVYASVKLLEEVQIRAQQAQR